jgi:small subunit ribosomal protein S8
MAMSDTIGDMLTRIRNAAGKRFVSVKCPYSKERQAILDVLEREGYILGSSVHEVRKGISDLEIQLKYFEGESVIRKIARVSKPGRRVYSSIANIALPYNGLGIYILSTQKGVMSDHEARTQNVGGEIICSVF